MVASRFSNALDSFGSRISSRINPIKAMESAGGLFGLRKMSLAEFSGCKANDDLHVVVRTDTNQAIGTVGNSYETFDNEAFFGPTAKALIDGTGARMDRFQMLNDGTRAFMRLSWPNDNITIGRPKVGDIVGRRATLSTSHDGKFAGRFVLQMLRLVCSNGMTAPVGEYDFTLTHTVGGHQQLVNLQEMIPMIERYVRQFEVAANMLVETMALPNTERVNKIIQQMVDPGDKAKKSDENKAQGRINEVKALFCGEQPGADSLECRGTGWGLYQAGNHYFTHKEGKPEQRFKSLLPGKNGGTSSKEILRAWSVVTDGLGVTDMIDSQMALTN